MEDNLRLSILDGCNERGEIGEVSADLGDCGWSLARFGVRYEAPYLRFGSNIGDVIGEVVAYKAGDARDQDSHG